ncbi:MAG: hypothetical protein ACREGH_03485 [Minisyncoccia bacterium]
MMSRWLEALYCWIIPSHKNAYHPHIIGERGLMLLFALIIGAEGFLVSNLIVSLPGPVPLAAVGNANTVLKLPPYLAAAGGVWTAYVVDPLARAAALPSAGHVAFFVLLGVTACLMVLLAFTLSMRQRKLIPIGYVAGSTMLAFAAALVLLDTQLVFPAATAMAIQNQIVQETASVAFATPHFMLASSTPGTVASSAASSTTSVASSTAASANWQQPTPEF